VVLYQKDTGTAVTACIATIEAFREGWHGEPFTSFRFCGYRGRPNDGTWYSGLAAEVLAS
jgi:hypothetical protein